MNKFKDYFLLNKDKLNNCQLKKINLFNSFFSAIAIHAILLLIFVLIINHKDNGFKPIIIQGSSQKKLISLKDIDFINNENKNIHKTNFVKPKEKNKQKQKIQKEIKQFDNNLTQQKNGENIKEKKEFPNKGIELSYGDSFFSLSAEEQTYIVDNWSDMNFLNLMVTQKISRKYDLNKVSVGEKNIVSFYLYPDGSISDLSFQHDNSSAEFIAIVSDSILNSVKLYKPVKVKTLIKINVNTQKNN